LGVESASIGLRPSFADDRRPAADGLDDDVLFAAPSLDDDLAGLLEPADDVDDPLLRRDAAARTIEDALGLKGWITRDRKD